MKSIFLVGGARPNFMKLAPLFHALERNKRFEVLLVHTGQHYDDRMSGSFFRDLELPEPHIALQVGSGSHGAQTARILERFEEQLHKYTPDVVVVFGDVNSTLACAVAAAKAEYPDGRRPKVAHVEAGLRSFDRGMPEEINRIVTDSISDYLFVTEQSGIDNLRREGGRADSMFLVGNLMIDSLLAQIPRARERAVWNRFDVNFQCYAVATLHRPSNVDSDTRLNDLMRALSDTAQRLKVIFPVHPRTRARLEALHWDSLASGVLVCEPQPYVDFLSLVAGARLVLTDSGGIQEETTMLGVPCLTLRDNTERPVTCEVGTNRLIGSNPATIIAAVDAVLGEPMLPPTIPPFWDGATAQRIAVILEELSYREAGLARTESLNRLAALNGLPLQG